MRKELIGHCGVDSGQIMLIDPCYVLSSKRDSKERKKDREGFYDELIEAWEFDKKPYKQFISDFHLGVVVSSGWGDGYYPVYIEYSPEGRIKSATIEFMEDE